MILKWFYYIMKTTTYNSVFDSIISQISSELDTTPDKRKRVLKISTKDATLSALAMFSLKCPSLLNFDKNYRTTEQDNNIKTIFKIKEIPSDTQMRTILDQIPNHQIKKLFPALFKTLQRDKKLVPYNFSDQRGSAEYLMAVDGLEIYSSQKSHCPHCMKKKTFKWN